MGGGWQGDRYGWPFPLKEENVNQNSLAREELLNSPYRRMDLVLIVGNSLWNMNVYSAIRDISDPASWVSLHSP